MALVIILQAFSGYLSPQWVLSHVGFSAQEYWRLFSGHLMHADFDHLSLNLLALLILGFWLEQFSRRLLLASILVGFFAVDLAYLTLLPSLDFYCGLSGMLNTLWAVLLFKCSHLLHPILLFGLLTGTLSKLGIEQFIEINLFSQPVIPSVPQAHVAGLTAGLFIICFNNIQHVVTH